MPVAMLFLTVEEFQSIEEKTCSKIRTFGTIGGNFGRAVDLEPLNCKRKVEVIHTGCKDMEYKMYDNDCQK